MRDATCDFGEGLLPAGGLRLWQGPGYPATPPWSHLSSPVSSCPAAFPRCGGRSATAACARRAPGPSSSACARVWALTAGLTPSPVSAPGCSHQTTAALGTGQRAIVTLGQAQGPTPRGVRGGTGQGGWPSTLSAQGTGEGWHWAVTQKPIFCRMVLHSQGTTPPNCQHTPCTVHKLVPHPQDTLEDSIQIPNVSDL